MGSDQFSKVPALKGILCRKCSWTEISFSFQIIPIRFFCASVFLVELTAIHETDGTKNTRKQRQSERLILFR